MKVERLAGWSHRRWFWFRLSFGIGCKGWIVESGLSHYPIVRPPGHRGPRTGLPGEARGGGNEPLTGADEQRGALASKNLGAPSSAALHRAREQFDTAVGPDAGLGQARHVCRPEETDEQTATCPVCLAVYVLDGDATADERSYVDA